MSHEEPMHQFPLSPSLATKTCISSFVDDWRRTFYTHFVRQSIRDKLNQLDETNLRQNTPTFEKLIFFTHITIPAGTELPN